MAVRLIRSGDGAIVAAQAVWNGGGPGRTRYFGAASCGGITAAKARARRHANAQHRTPVAAGRRTNSGGVPGITLGREGATVYVRATWVDDDGRPCATQYSTHAHGRIGATLLALQARINGQALGRLATEREARHTWRRLRANYAHLLSNP